MATTVTEVSGTQWANMVPKTETNSKKFLDANPKDDGRGIIVAVFDTGVDPGASGLQTTPQGDDKMIAIIDCTGDGDISCKSSVSAVMTDDDCFVLGLTGRTLKLNKLWKNPTGVWKLGIKRGYELFPSPLKHRLKTEAKKDWDERQAKSIASVSQLIAEWNQNNVDLSSVAPSEIKKKQDLDAQMDYLNSFEFDHPGPIYDIVCWNDGEKWRGAIDCNTDGDMSNAEGLTAFDDEHRFGSFGDVIQLNYTLSVHEGGDLVNICCDCGSHGTHVAGIIGAYRPDQPDLNGVAPGCQIMSCKIGDIRVDTMETTRALTRAIAEAVRHGAHVINMSFGEHTSAANTGYFVKICEEAVNKHGLIFICSAGNAGPALTTAGAPGATSDCIIGIGAYVSSQMMKTCYSMVDKVQNYETKYTWSSVGPAPDGGQGAHITAPGGAITSIPNWTLAKSQLMNGTSMSSPNSAGCVALLLSGLKAKQIKWSKHRIQRALTNTARYLPECSERAQGSGLIQVDAAFDYLTKFANDTIEDVEFRVSVSGARGIYLRDASQQQHMSTHLVTIRPTFHEDSPKKLLIDFEVKLKLTSEQPWVTVPEDFVLAAKPRPFKVMIDPTQLCPGDHYAHIYGYDAETNRGALFRVPITVTKPLPLAVNPSIDNFTLCRGSIRRIFVTPPPGSTSMDVMVKRATGCKGTAGKSIVVLHTMQMVKNRSYAEGEKKTYLHMQPGHYDVISRKVDGQSSVEVCIASYWSELESVSLEVDVMFKGLSPDSTNLVLAPGRGFARVDVTASIADETISPVAKLTKMACVVHPTSTSCVPLDARHNLLDKQIHELSLDYKLNFDEATSITPRFPIHQDRCYEAELIGGPTAMFFDSKKKVLGTTDLYPSEVKVPKGEVVVKCVLRHHSASLLKNYETLALVVERPLVKTVTLKCFDSATDIQAKKTETTAKTLPKGRLATLHFKEPSADELPKESVPGDYFIGTVSYGKVKTEKIGDYRPGGFKLEYHYAGKPTKVAEPKIALSPDMRGDEQKLTDAIRDLKLKTLAGMVGKESFNALFTSISTEYENDLDFESSKMRHLDAVALSTPKVETNQAVVDQAGVVISLIDQDELIKFLGTNVDTEDPKEVDRKEKMTKNRTALVDALTCKTLALAELDSLPDEDDFESSVKELKKWEKLDDDKHLKVNLEIYRKNDWHGSLIKAIAKALKKNEGVPDAKLISLQKTALTSVGFGHIVEYMQQWNLVNSPPGAYPCV